MVLCFDNHFLTMVHRKVLWYTCMQQLFYHIAQDILHDYQLHFFFKTIQGLGWFMERNTKLGDSGLGVDAMYDIPSKRSLISNLAKTICSITYRVVV